MSYELRFTDEEIQAGADALLDAFDSVEATRAHLVTSGHEAVRAILRAVGAAPARMLPVGQAGYPAEPGVFVEGMSHGGRKRIGQVQDSRPVTTDILAADGEQYVLWTSTIASAAKPAGWPPVEMPVHRSVTVDGRTVLPEGPPGA